MCFNCKRDQVGQLSASKGWCTDCMNAFKEGVKEGHAQGYRDGDHDAAMDAMGAGR